MEECLVKPLELADLRLDNRDSMLDDFYARIRIQDWYRDLSEQKSEEEMQQTVARIEGQDANGENQPGAENSPTW